MRDDPPLKLRAEDLEDLAVIAACLQDAQACLGEMAYDAEARRFALVVVRFAWEAGPGISDDVRRAALGQSVAGLHFDDVSAVRVRHIDQSARRQLLRLLTITGEPHDKPTSVTLHFVGGGQVRLEIDRLHCHLRDLEAPHHSADDADVTHRRAS